ncbi:MAG: ribonuclease R [Nitrospirae bacterium]|nr:MAG: ribonuclease R [Nitrospirota bacterium]
MAKAKKQDKDIVVKLLKRSRRPLTFREIVTSLELSRAEARSLKKLLRRMLKEGSIIMTRRGRYGLPEEMRLVKGYFEAHRDGYGFVIPEEPGQRDIFVPPHATLGAMEGDRVIVRVERERKREGRVLRILERAHKQVVGTLKVQRGLCYLEPKRKDINFDLYIAPSHRKGARDGDLVLAHIISYPTEKRPPAAEVIRVLGEPERPVDDIELVIDEFSLPRRFPRDVYQEVRAVLPEIPKRELKRRKDLTALPTVTIDGERAKDFDDAVSIIRRDFGYTLFVHIADVGYYVPWNSKTDLEARKRATSVYFPDRVIPMLPKKLSEELCSLKPRKKRLAFTVEMDFDRDGNRLDQRFYKSVIESNERMTYTQVKGILVDRDPGLRGRYSKLLEEFELMGELCEILRMKRFRRGSLDFDLPEPEVLLNLRGELEDIIVAERNFAHMIIEEFMIAANEAVAEFLYHLDVPSIYRVHEPPDEDRMMELSRFLSAAGIIKKGPIKPKELPALIERTKGTNISDVVNHMILRSLKQARYHTENLGHFGLASLCYTHFTSPIRRYPDLVVHRVLAEVLDKVMPSEKYLRFLEENLGSISFHCSRQERLADEVERTVVDAMRAWLMKDRVGEEFDARVITVTAQGIKIRLCQFYVEGFIHVSDLTDDYYIFDENSLTLRGKRTKRLFRIGTTLKVRLDGVDLKAREVHFAPSEA